MQQATTLFLSVVLLVGTSLLIYAARLKSATLSSFTITLLNVITPIIVKKLQTFESHRNQSSYEASQFIKITLFRWVNTAVVTKAFTPFTETLPNGSFLIDSILSIFISEITVTPILAALDYMSNIKKHILGSRAVDQRRMNLNFTGGYYNIGERYTAATKVLFFTLFYCTLFPQGFFFGAAILTITYWTDKRSLLRAWAASPKIGSAICTFTRKYFIPLAVMTYAIIGSYDYTAFPFDNACETSSSPVGNYVGIHKLKVLNGDLIQVSVPQSATSYKFCNQDMKSYSDVAFPAVPLNQPEDGKWMKQEQEDFSSIYGWVGFGAFCVTIFNLCVAFFSQFAPYFFSKYKPHGKMTEYEFSKQDSIQGYIPQIMVSGYSFPILLCDVDGVHPFVGWQNSKDPDYDMSNILLDVQKVSLKIEKRRSTSNDSLEKPTEDDDKVFSAVKFWDPTGMEE